MGSAPTCLEEVIGEMLALQRALPQRPTFLELEIAMDSVAKADEALAEKQKEFQQQPKPEDVPYGLFSVLQEMRAEVAERATKEKKKDFEAVLQLEQRHRRYDEWIQRAHDALSSKTSSTAAKGIENQQSAVTASKDDSKQSDVSGRRESARSVLDASWEFPPTAVSSTDTISSLDVADAKPRRSIPATIGRSDSFSRVSQALSWAKEPQQTPSNLEERQQSKVSSVHPLVGRVDIKNRVITSDHLSDVKRVVSVSSTLDSATQDKQTRLSLCSKEIESLPESVGKMIWLTELNVCGNKLSVLPESLGHLVNLANLDVSSNQLRSLPESLGQLTFLKVLCIDNNKIEELPYTIGQCRSLVEIRASFNQLKALPEATGKLTQLTLLDIHWNKLSTLPSTMATMECLADLDASFNEIRCIPEGLCQVTTLTRLNLSSNFNELQELPESIGNLKKLKVLNLSCNQLRVLPDSFALLTNLRDLDLTGNNWRLPPKEIADQGAEAVLKYMADYITEKEKPKQPLPKKSSWTKLFFTCGRRTVVEGKLPVAVK